MGILVQFDHDELLENLHGHIFDTISLTEGMQALRQMRVTNLPEMPEKLTTVWDFVTGINRLLKVSGSLSVTSADVQTTADSEARRVVPTVSTTGWDANTEERNKYIYDQAMAGTPWASIKRAVDKHEGWEKIEGDNGIKYAANEYARRLELPHPVTRQPGRRRNTK